MLLTSMYLAIGNSLNALPSQLGQLTMWRALVQASLCCFADFLSACLKYTSDHSLSSLLWPRSVTPETLRSVARPIQINSTC